MLRSQSDNLRAAGIEERVGANNSAPACNEARLSKASSIGLGTGLHDVELQALFSRRRIL
jgi:hypothetical protein